MTLTHFKNLSIHDINHDTLVDINDINIDTTLPKEERMKSMITQMNGNPYFFKSGKITVKIGFTNTHTTLDEKMEGYLQSL